MIDLGEGIAYIHVKGQKETAPRNKKNNKQLKN